LVSGGPSGLPSGATGFFNTDDLIDLVFVHDGSPWVVPYALIRGIAYVETESPDDLLRITFSGARSDAETATFRLPKETALSLAGVLSARTGETIHFAKNGLENGRVATDAQFPEPGQSSR
jgi:hypothetical protein